QRERERKQLLGLGRLLLAGFERPLDEGGGAQLGGARRQRRLVERGVQRRRLLREICAALPRVELPELDHRDGEQRLRFLASTAELAPQAGRALVLGHCGTPCLVT